MIASTIYGGSLWCNSDGILILGTGSNVGTFRSGQSFYHSVRVVNLTGKYVQVSSYPTCGCINISVLDATVTPFSYIDIPMQFQTGEKKTGLKERTISLVYNIGGQYHLVNKSIYFRATS